MYGGFSLGKMAQTEPHDTRLNEHNPNYSAAPLFYDLLVSQVTGVAPVYSNKEEANRGTDGGTDSLRFSPRTAPRRRDPTASRKTVAPPLVGGANHVARHPRGVTLH